MDAKVSGPPLSTELHNQVAHVQNIAVIFNTVIFGPDQVPLDGNALSMHHGKDTVLEDLITYADLVRTLLPSRIWKLLFIASTLADTIAVLI